MDNHTLMPTIDDKAVDLDSRALSAIESRDEAERLIADFQPFLHSCVIKYCHDRGSVQYDDLYSAALLAFYEAISSFDIHKGHFFSFAGSVVKRRLIDSVRKKYRDRDNLPLQEAEEDDEHTSSIDAASLREYGAQTQADTLRLEIEQFKAELATWNITLKELYNQSPKQTSLKSELRRGIIAASKDENIMQTLLLRRYLPISSISELTKIAPKKLNRARKYIIASLLILSGDYEHIEQYIVGE